MCGRYTYLYKWKQLWERWQLAGSGVEPPWWRKIEVNYNVAPTQFVPIVRIDPEGNREATPMRWGLIPHWSKDEAIGQKCINARSEEAASKPAFREAMKKRRCLVPMSSFYEWQTIEGERKKQPWLIRVKDEPLFGVAGLWERWEGGPEPVETFTILTQPPNEFMAKLHNRMPVIVSPDHYDRWLDPAITDVSKLADAMRPFPAEGMEAHRVSTRVNSVVNNDAGLLLASADETKSLFR